MAGQLLNPYLRQKKCYYPVFAIGEEVSFYINFNQPSTVDASQLRLCLYKDDTIISDNIGVINSDLVGEDSITGYELYNYYAKFICPEVTPGIYEMIIYNYVTNKTLLVSNSIEIMQPEQANEVTQQIEYSNVSKIYNFMYDSGFTNKFRLHIFEEDRQYETEVKQYRPVTTGKIRNIRTTSDRILTLETYYFDEEAHEAAAAMFIHSDIFISGIKVEPRTAYKITPRDRIRNVNKGQIEVVDVNYSMINKFQS